jgi:AcrR family transcriptional regulator
MHRQVRTTPRKRPRQDRAKATVDSILVATARVLVKLGFDGLNTNAVAAAAGVSIGSLYQYFPNKDAIVIAVLDRFADHLADRLGAEIEATMRLPWEEAGHALLDAQIRLFEEDADLLRIIVEQVPRLGPFDKLAALQRRLTDLIRVYLLVNRAAFRDDLDIDATLWIITETVGMLSIKYVLDRPPIPHERMVDELAELVIGHIRGRT